MAHHGFPQFSDGNVEIHFSETDEKYVLHNYVLALHSPWFKASLSDRWNPEGTGALINGKHTWVYELRFDKDSAVGLLARKAALGASSSTDTEFISGSKGQFPTGADEAQISLESHRIAVLKAHQDMLCCLYHVAPAFSHSSLGKAQASILSVAKVAELYGCEAVVKLHIEGHIRLYQREVLDQCCDHPLAMLELATTIKSEWIFMEAATHLLGRSKRFYEKSQAKLTELGIADFLNEKRITLHERKDAWAHPALAFFREWLAGELRNKKGSKLGPGYAKLYHTIGNEKFTLKVPTQRKQVQDYYNKLFDARELGESHALDEELAYVFGEAADIISPILKDHTRRQDKRQDVHRALLFMRIEDDELPWVKK